MEVGVEGKRQGVTKKKINTEAGRLKICKVELFKSFINVCNLKGIHTFDDLTYDRAKKMADGYQKNWLKLKTKFGIWTRKDRKLLNFALENTKNAL